MDAEKEINEQYSTVNHDYSSSLDVLASYLKGQKIIYMEAKYYCERNLNKLMMPAILLSTAATVLAAIVSNYNWGSMLISSVNAVIAFLLALVNYFKLDAASEAHKISAHQYDKLQSSVEFTSGALLLFGNFKKNKPQKVIKNEDEFFRLENNKLTKIDIDHYIKYYGNNAKCVISQNLFLHKKIKSVKSNKYHLGEIKNILESNK
jgi:hypothetical protein